MPGPLEAAGAVKNPSKYAGLGMQGRQMTGLVTQKSPYRDGAVPYLVAKFYGGSRFDTIWDGSNREISQRLTDVRSPGSTVYNSNSWLYGASFFSWKFIQNNVEIIRVIYDCSDNGIIYDATAGVQEALYDGTGGLTPSTRFLSVNTELFFTTTQVTKKILEGSITWSAGANVLPGTLINEGSAPGTMYMALGGLSLSIVATEVVASTLYIYTNQQTVPDQFPNLVQASISFSGLTSATFLNGTTMVVTAIPSSTLAVFTTNISHADYAYATDTGTASTGSGFTGGTIPGFSATRFNITADSGQQWKCYGPALQNWGIAAATTAPVLTPQNGTRIWQANTVLSFRYAILDTNGDIEMAANFTAGSGGIYKTGRVYPTWVTNETQTDGYNMTIDGTIVWWNLGAAGAWAPSAVFYTDPTQGVAVILDSNQNLQWVSNGSGGTSGSSAPTWNATINGTTTDGGLTWTCLGPGVIIASAGVGYAYSYHGIDGSVSTAALPATIQGGILGIAITEDLQFGDYLQLTAPTITDTQLDQVWIWRTAIGQATLILEDQIPLDTFGTSFFYNEYGIPDTTTNGQGALDAEVAAPVADANDPPPIGMTAPVYYQQRIWAIYKNTVIHSGGPDTLVGNGNTAFAPLDEFPFTAQPVKLIPVLVQNGGLIVMTTSGIKIILGTGTQSNPYYVGDYLELVSILNYSAATVFYNQIFCMESNGKVSSLAIEYPFNPQTGYTEIGFPIGDQFVKTTTGGYSAALFNPATAYVTWNANSSADTGMYVSDGAGHWFRLSMINPPESGMLWSPIRTIQGGASAVQSVEISPGVHVLLIAPASSGPILMRDTTGAVFTDNGAAYDAWDAKGPTLLCGTGEWADVAHISTKSKAVGARPTISVLFNEINPVTPATPNAASASYTPLALAEKSQNPTRGRQSVSVFSDRYDLEQNGVEAEGDCLLIKFDYGAQTVADELYDFGIYASVHDEREEAEAK